MPTASVNDQAIHYADNGTDGPAVIWSHGFLMDHTMFDAQVAGLGGSYRCIRWDERGFGETNADAPFSYWDSADDCIGLLDHLGIEQAVLAGMSQGGFLSLRAALAYPDRVRALILIDTEPGVDPPEVIAGYQGMIEHWLGDEPLGAVAEGVAGLILGEPKLNAEWIAKWEQRRGERIRHAANTLFARDDVTKRMGEITCPVLIVHGTDDQSISIDKARALQAALPDCRGLVEIEGAAHAPNMTHAEPVNAAIAQFLDSL